MTLRARGETLSLSPLFVRDELIGVLAVLPNAPLKRATEESLATLGAEVALALQSAALTEETLNQRSEARLGALIKNASDVICIVGRDTAIRYLSPSVQQMFGHLPETLSERPLTDVVHPDDIVRVAAFLAAIASQPLGQSQMAEFRVRHSVQGWRDVEALGANLLGEEGVDGIVLNIRDISERKSLQGRSSSTRPSTTLLPASPTGRCSATGSSMLWVASTATASRSRSCSSISTTSRPSTTVSGTPRETGCCRRWGGGLRTACAPPTPPRALGASSPS